MANTPEDDWFPQPEPGTSPDAARLPHDDEWLMPDEAPSRSPSFDPWSLASPKVLVPIVLALAFLIGLLAAFGAFDSGAAPPATVPGNTAPVITSKAPTTTAKTTTTTQTTTTKHPTVVPPTTTLKPGDSGAQVKVLQQELKDLGFTIGKIDGFYGKATSKAVTAFQRAHKLTADGVVGPATLAALAP